MLNLNSVILFSQKPKALVIFYKKILDMKPAWKGGDFVGFMVGNGMLVIGPHDKVKGKNENPERIMINFETTHVRADYQRMVVLGAREIATPYQPSEAPDEWLATLADPDGNFFQLISPMTASHDKLPN